jgi:2,3-bisphosphoglycerate-independent phosphoglycerate mutase
MQGGLCSPLSISQESIMLQKSASFPGIQGPIVTIIMDGYGIAKSDVGSAVAAARKPTLDRLFANYPNITLRAHGIAVGMPSDEDMGNSEVGHNAIGAGQVYSQGAALVADAITAGSIWQGSAWQQIVAGAHAGRGVIHFIGLFSDGNVHSHIDHLRAMVLRAKEEGVPTVRIHILIDGRDVPETSALDYVLPFETFLAEIGSGSFDARIASGGGRMNITMDRYEANWNMVEKGWHTHVLGRRGPIRQRFGRNQHPARQVPGDHRPGSAALRHRPGRTGRRDHRRRRLGGLFQLPRRPLDRDHAGV